MALTKKDLFLLNLLLFLTFDLMLLGAGVRTMNAGLTCPDWPLCFGKIVPKYHFGVYLEFIHRVIAGLVGILYMVFFVQALRKQEFKKIRFLSFVGLFLLIAQIVMGGLTVLKLLQAYIVTMHLSLATAFLVSLFVIKKTLILSEQKKNHRTKLHKLFNLLTVLIAIFVCVQIVLGGLVASTYSGLVCIDFPTCNGQYFPLMHGPIGIQMLHRFGAYWLSFLVVALLGISVFCGKTLNMNREKKILSAQIFFLLGVQVFVGVMNLKFLMPALLSVLHLALALTILLTTIRLYFSLR